jgi:molybdopterin-guanine dinucleotide biosynthesis protein B
MMHVIAFVGSSGAGKTTLMEKLITLFKERGLRVSTVKHTHHSVEIDHQGKDTWRMKKAGSFEVVLVSDSEMSLQRTFEQNSQMTVHEAIAQMYEGVDWVFVEGFKSSDLLKVEVIRPQEGLMNPFFLSDDFVVAVAYSENTDLPVTTALPVLPLDNAEIIADWLINQQDRFVYPPSFS